MPSSFFEAIACPICRTSEDRTYLELPYKRLKQKKSLDYRPLGIGPESMLRVGECGECGFVFANPRVKKEFESKIYNECKVALYTRTRPATAESAHKELRRAAHYAEPILEMIDLLPTSATTNGQEARFFEFGCGMGKSLRIARSLGLQAYGVDLDEERLNRCRAEGFKVDTPDRFLETHPGFQADMILMQSIIEHLIDPRMALEWIRQISKPGTLLYITGLTPRMIERERAQGAFVKAHFIEHVNYFPIATLDRWMREFGYEPAPWNKATILRGFRDLARACLSRILVGTRFQAYTSGVFRRIYVCRGADL